MLIRLSPLFGYFELWCDNPDMHYFLARLTKPVFNAAKVVDSCTLKHLYVSFNLRSQASIFLVLTMRCCYVAQDSLLNCSPERCRNICGRMTTAGKV